MSSDEVPAGLGLQKIEVFLRFVDDELVAMKSDLSADRLLSVVEDPSDVTVVLERLRGTLGEVARALGVPPQPVDGRRRVRGSLHVLWEDVVEMSPDRLRKQFGLRDLPEAWPDLQRKLLAAVELAIRDLG